MQPFVNILSHRVKAGARKVWRSKMNIGYITQVFPSLSETFVYREIQALRARGIQVKTFSIRKSELYTSSISDKAKDLVDSTFYIFPLNFCRFLIAHLWYLIRQPHRYFGTLWFCLTGEHKTLKNRLRTFYHFCQAIPIAIEVKRIGIKHLHAHFALNPTTLAMVVSRLGEVSFSFTAHANDIFCNPILLKEKIRAARFIIAISDYNKQFLFNILPTPETLNKIQVIHCGIDVQNFCPQHDRRRSDKPIVLAVGRMVEKKGFPYLIRACKILLDKPYDFRCLILGDGPQKGLLNQIIRDAKLSDVVELPGIVYPEHIRAYFAKADIFVLPCIVGTDNDIDGIPVTLMEAMAMEIPTISTNISGIPELIDHMETGILVPPKDEVSLANAISTLIENDDLSRIIGKAGRSKVKSEFEIQKNVDLLMTIFELHVVDSHSTKDKTYH